MSEILSKLFQHPNSTKLAAYKLIQDANPNPSNPEEWLSKFRSSAEKSVQSAALQYRKAPAGERLNNDEAMAITGQTLDMLFTDSKERWSPQNKMLWRTFMELYSVAPKIAGKREMLNKTLEFYYKKGFDGAQQTMQTTQPIQQPQSRPTTGIYSVERVIKTHRDLQAQVESHPERQFPAGFIKKRTVDGPLWVPLIVENGCFYTKNPDVIASAMGGGDEHLTEIMEGKARQLAAGNEKQVGVVIIPFTRSRIETMDDRVELVTNNIAGLEPFPKYLKPLRSPKPLTAPVEFKSEEQRAKWEAAHALICKHNPNKTKDTNIDLAYDIYTPANRPYLMRFQQDFDSWERVKDIIARKMTKDGVPEAEIRQNIEMIARSHCWWDRNFKPPTDGKPFKNVFMVEGELDRKSVV